MNSVSGCCCTLRVCCAVSRRQKKTYGTWAKELTRDASTESSPVVVMVLVIEEEGAMFTTETGFQVPHVPNKDSSSTYVEQQQQQQPSRSTICESIPIQPN